jgi:hypothetical protein
VVAEGVEDVATEAVLREMGCDRAQGYLYAPAMSVEQFIVWWVSRQDVLLSALRPEPLALWHRQAAMSATPATGVVCVPRVPARFGLALGIGTVRICVGIRRFVLGGLFAAVVGCLLLAGSRDGRGGGGSCGTTSAILFSTM